MTDSKEEFVAKIKAMQRKRKQALKMARIDVSNYFTDRYIAALRKRTKRTKQGRKP